MKAFAKYHPVEGGFRRVVKEGGIPVDYQIEVKLVAIKENVVNYEIIGDISSKAKWVKEGDEIEIELIPIISAGTNVYNKDDKKKRAYRWKIWDDAEKFPEYYEFIDIKEAKYRCLVKCPCCEEFK